ncbi:hypothetical protein FJ950_22910 [Mesorhizobium sp. B2-3-14]|nr:hypothetical protein FJ950_22910 [Mesorhizobium sp. B2-3-14]
MATKLQQKLGTCHGRGEVRRGANQIQGNNKKPSQLRRRAWNMDAVVLALLQAFAWAWYFKVPEWWALALIAITTVTFLGGFVLVLVGREYDSIVDETSTTGDPKWRLGER